MNDQVIVVRKREETGTGASRRYRAAGRIPAVVYGAKKDSIPISVDRSSVLNLLRQGGGDNAIFLLKMEGTEKERHAMIRDMEIHSTRREILHIDFLRLLMDQVIRVMVPVELVGIPLGVQNDGGVLDHVTREVELECLPGDIPQQLEVDVSELYIGQHVEVRDLQVPDNVTLLEEEGRVVAAVGAPRELEEIEEEEELLLEAEAEEPEVIGRGKEEEEGEGEEETEEG